MLLQVPAAGSQRQGPRRVLGEAPRALLLVLPARRSPLAGVERWSGELAPMKCPSCDGSGSAFQDEWPVHIPCGECAGTGYGEVAEAAREIDVALAYSRGSRYHPGDAHKYARKRRETIARYVASAIAARERSER